MPGALPLAVVREQVADNPPSDEPAVNLNFFVYARAAVVITG